MRHKLQEIIKYCSVTNSSLWIHTSYIINAKSKLSVSYLLVRENFTHKYIKPVRCKNLPTSCTNKQKYILVQISDIKKFSKLGLLRIDKKKQQPPNSSTRNMSMSHFCLLVLDLFDLICIHKYQIRWAWALLHISRIQCLF